MKAEIEANVLDRTAQRIEVKSIEWGSNTATVSYTFAGENKRLVVEGEGSGSIEAVKFLGKVIAWDIIDPGHYAR